MNAMFKFGKLLMIAMLCFSAGSVVSQSKDNNLHESEGDANKIATSSNYANYFSFHGSDENSKVYFAIDNNRVKKKNAIKANNFLYFNIDSKWIKLKGHTNFKSEETDIRKCSNSVDFKFEYKDGNLISIESPTNDLRIIFNAPLKHIGAYGEAAVSFDMYATNATLIYKGREFQGNLISERFIDPEGLKSISNITKVLFNGFKYDGYYLNVVGLGDLYVHLVSPEKSINIFTDNIYNLNSQDGFKDFKLERANYKVTKFKRVGFKKLPLEIEIDLGESKLTLRTSHFQKYRNLLFFAFGMGTVDGTLIHEGKEYEVYGLSELFEF